MDEAQQHRGADDGAEAVLVVHTEDGGAVAALEALLAAAGPHLQRVLDLGTGRDGEVAAVLEPLPVGLDELLATPGWPSPGEAVTVLVPLAGLTRRLHESGVAGLGLQPSTVRFDAAGTPVVVASPGLRSAAAAGAAGFAHRAADDRRALLRLATHVVARAGLPVATLTDDPEGLEDALFALAVPAPVRLRPRPAGPPHAATPARLLVPVAAPASDPHEPTVPARRLPDAFRGFATRLRLPGRLNGVRRRTWLAAGGSVGLLVAAVALLPGAGASATAPVASASASAAPLRTSLTEPVAPGPPTRSVPPAVAARVLLDARRVCLAGRSLRCLQALEAPGSPIAVLDAAAVTAGVDAVDVPAAAPRVRRISGAAATLDVGDATVLLVQEPAGWRLRDAGRPAPRPTPKG